MSLRSRTTSVLALLMLTVAVLSACSLPGAEGADGTGDPVPSASPTPAQEEPEATQFTRDGTFQSHINIEGVDFVYTLYPTKATPRTNEWYPRGKKYFTMTMSAYDLDRELRDKFSTKREVYLDRISVTSTTDTSEAGAGDQPYTLNAQAKKITLDPEPLTKRDLGMLITSPKGSFELRNQAIGEVSEDTRLVTLKISASVYIERNPGSGRFDREEVEQEVPITIFASDQETQATEIPYTAN